MSTIIYYLVGCIENFRNHFSEVLKTAFTRAHQYYLNNKAQVGKVAKWLKIAAILGWLCGRMISGELNPKEIVDLLAIELLGKLFDF